MNKKERHNISNKKWRDNNKGYYKEWRANHKEALAIYKKEYQQTPEGKKSMIIGSWKRSGIIDEDLSAVYDVYVKETTCMICLKKYKDSSDRCLDHDHKSGEIRYICCRNCNTNFLRESKPP